MKILTIFPSFSNSVTGGAGGLLLHLCDELIKTDNEVTLLTTEIGKVWNPLINSRLEIIQTGFSTRTKKRDLDLVLQHYEVARMYKYIDKGFDIINIHNYPSPIASSLARKLKGVKIPVVYQCNEPPRVFYDLRKETIRNASTLKKMSLYATTPFLRGLDKWSVGSVDEIVSISKFMQKHIEEIYSRENTFIMPGIEIDRFRPDIDGSIIRSKYAGENDFVVLSSNILHFRKRIDLLVRAIPSILRKHKNIKVIVTGDGPERAKLEILVKELGLEKNVFLTGFLPMEELPKYYAACDVFAFTAIREPQIGSPAEALASGKPVIAPNDGSPAETIIEGKTGFLYKPLDYEDMAKKIIWCIENKYYVKKMSGNCRNWVEKNMTWKKMAKENVVLFKSLLENG